MKLNHCITNWCLFLCILTRPSLRLQSLSTNASGLRDPTKYFFKILIFLGFFYRRGMCWCIFIAGLVCEYSLLVPEVVFQWKGFPIRSNSLFRKISVRSRLFWESSLFLKLGLHVFQYCALRAWLLGRREISLKRSSGFYYLRFIRIWSFSCMHLPARLCRVGNFYYQDYCIALIGLIKPITLLHYLLCYLDNFMPARLDYRWTSDVFDVVNVGISCLEKPKCSSFIFA